MKALLPELSICRKVMLYHATKRWEHFDIWPFTIKPFIKMYNRCPESQSQNIQFNDLKISPDDLVARLPLASVFAIGLTSILHHFVHDFCLVLFVCYETEGWKKTNQIIFTHLSIRQMHYKINVKTLRNKMRCCLMQFGVFTAS